MIGRVQRVDSPSPSIVVLTVYQRDAGKRILVFDAANESLRWVPKRPAGQAADGFVRRLRKLLVGANVDRVEHRGNRVRLGFQLRARVAWLVSRRGTPVLREDDGRPLAGRGRFATESMGDGWQAFELDDAVTVEPSSDDHRERDQLRARLKAHVRKLRRKVSAIEKDAARAAKAPTLRHEADLIVAHLHEWDGGTSLTVVDWETSETRAIPIDPKLGAKAQADKRYKSAKRFERGAKVAAQRLAEVASTLTDAEALRDRIDHLGLDELKLALEALGVARPQAPPGRKREQARVPFRTFVSGSQRILVGKGPRDNDSLTLDARPYHHWLHARGVGGAHVVVPLDKGTMISSEVLVDAATLAAHFSKSRGDDRIEVQHTPRKHVRKPRGFPPGAVRVTQEKVIVVRMEPERLRRLLNSERI